MHDLTAISTAIGPHGGNCVAVVQPLLDLRLLSNRLRLLPRNYSSQVPEMMEDCCLLRCYTFYEGAMIDAPPQTGGRGLGGLVEWLFGLPMDKRLQCSAWHRRPLSTEQVRPPSGLQLYVRLEAALCNDIWHCCLRGRICLIHSVWCPSTEAAWLHSRPS